jgi:hypothetical protein
MGVTREDRFSAGRSRLPWSEQPVRSSDRQVRKPLWRPDRGRSCCAHSCDHRRPAAVGLTPATIVTVIPVTLSRGSMRAACGVVAGPLFVSVFTKVGGKRAGYDWRRHAVSSLADGREGWAQRANFDRYRRALLRCRPRSQSEPEPIRAACGSSVDSWGGVGDSSAPACS